MNRKVIIALGLAIHATTAAAAEYAYNAKTGALSYTFFNLSPNSCSFTSYGAGKNPNATTHYASYHKPYWSNTASDRGWGSGKDKYGFFMTEVNNGDDKLLYNYIFYNNLNDQITAATPALSTLAAGASATTVEYISATNNGLNPPALADSWAITCGNGNGTIVMANMASAANGFASIGNLNAGFNGYGTLSDNFGECPLQGFFHNSNINPPSAGATGGNDNDYGYDNDNDNKSAKNPYGTGFVGDGKGDTLNFNNSDTTTTLQTGGLWMGLYNPNTNNQAVNSLNLAMYPINMAAYVTNKPGDKRSTCENTSTQKTIMGYSENITYSQYRTPIFGGHFTLAIGDPYLISSYAAKTLWYWITNPNLSFYDNQSLSTPEQVNGIINTLLASGSTSGVFSNSESNDYLKWLLYSPSNAASVIGTLNTAASKPIVKTSIWGKIFSGLTDVAIDSVSVGIKLAVGPEAGIAAGLTTNLAGASGLTSMATSAITADFTTTSFFPVVSQTAAPYVNATYSASNLLGILLSNTFVQTEINATLTDSNSGSYPLWSNYSINTSSQCTGISLTNNLMGGTCSGINNAGTQPASTQSYNNVLTTYANSFSTSQLNIWNAILNGADIDATTNTNSVTSNAGYMKVVNPTIASFSPPVLLVNATTGTPDITGVNVTFNNTSGLLTLASYTTSTNEKGVILGASGDSPVQTSSPTLTLTTPAGRDNIIIAPDNQTQVTFNNTSGKLTVAGYRLTTNGNYIPYTFSNGSQTLDMTMCASNAANLTIFSTISGQTSALGFLSCQSPPSLPYNLCTNDPGATGGVIAAVTDVSKMTADSKGATFELGCTCIPSYLGGASSTKETLGGVHVGATSLNPNNRCS